MAIEMEGTLEAKEKKYDWDKWLNGKQWMLIQGVDFEMSPEQFRPQITTAAGNRLLRATTRITRDDEGRPAVLVQSRPRSEPGKPTLRLPPPQHATAGDAIDQNKKEHHAE